MMEPAAAGARVLQAVREDRLYVITHGEWQPMAAARHAASIEAMPKDLDPALAAMLQGQAGAAGQALRAIAQRVLRRRGELAPGARIFTRSVEDAIWRWLSPGQVPAEMSERSRPTS
jgi:hypothetical protein